MSRGVQLPGYIQTDLCPPGLGMEYRVEGEVYVTRSGHVVCTWDEAIERGWFVLEYDQWDLGVRP